MHIKMFFKIHLKSNHLSKLLKFGLCIFILYKLFTLICNINIDTQIGLTASEIHQVENKINKVCSLIFLIRK